MTSSSIKARLGTILPATAQNGLAFHPVMYTRPAVVFFVLPSILAAVPLGLAGLQPASERGWDGKEPVADTPLQPAAPDRTSAPAPTQIRSGTAADSAVTEPQWLVVGGGASPELSDASLEWDAALAERVLKAARGEGEILFGPGPGTRAVRETVQGTSGWRTELAELVSPAGGRDTRYRNLRINVRAAADAATVREHLMPLLSKDNPWVFFATHGGPGINEEDAGDPASNEVSLWNSSLTVRELAALLQSNVTHPSDAHLVVASCYSGGFAEVIFRDGDASKGPSPDFVGCGFFASTWDRESSGCDPNPDRSTHNGYSIHFWNALSGRDRNGALLAREALDINHDGVIGGLEAHLYAAVATGSIDIPTTTSERWLRFVSGEERPIATGTRSPPFVQAGKTFVAQELPEYDELITKLRQETGVHDASARLELLKIKQEQLQTELEALTKRSDEAASRALGHMLARWPELHDPWRADFEQTLTTQGAVLERWLQMDPDVATWRDAEQAVSKVFNQLGDLETTTSSLLQLARALETVALAEHLANRKSIDGPARLQWEQYQRLLACEREGLATKRPASNPNP